MQLHFDYFKLYSTLLVQLRTSKIDFNQFLYKRRMLEITTKTCNCDQERIIVKYLLLVYSRQRQKRAQMQQKTNITNLRQLLDEAKLVVATIYIILFIKLLSQFQTTLLSKKRESSQIYKVLVWRISLYYEYYSRDVEGGALLEQCAINECAVVN